EENTFLEMLKLIPDTPDTRSPVYIIDYARIREIYEIALPSSDADNDDEILDFKNILDFFANMKAY
ncbi:hypothetical protein ACFLWS_06055, partial [Chloroflexota bacterium]